METQDLQPITKIPFHKHNGADSPRIRYEDILQSPEGLKTIQVASATVSPTYSSQNGTIIIQFDATHWVIWIRVNNLWKSVALT
jgi:hypothetical protein